MERTVEEEVKETTPPTIQKSEPNDEWLGLALLVLQVLGKRSVAFVGHLIPVIALGTGCYLWASVLPSPSVYQLVGLGGYAAFMLGIMIVRRV